MKSINILITLLMIGCINCSKDNDQNPVPVKPLNMDTISFAHSMKGWELYSWPNGNDWNYSILLGMNRSKTYDEIITNNIIVCGKDTLKMLLDKFPGNEQITWIGEGCLDNVWGGTGSPLSLPGKSIIGDINNYCIQKKLVLNICE